MIHSDGFATSCKDLSEQEAERIIRKMEALAVNEGRWTRVEGRKMKYEELGKRQGMATPKQLRMIEAMWAGVSKYRAAEQQSSRAAALRGFLKRIVGVDDLRFIEGRQARKVIEALKAMNRQ